MVSFHGDEHDGVARAAEQARAATGKTHPDWTPIEMELARPGSSYVARVTRHHAGAGSGWRWRWSVCKIDVTQRWNRLTVAGADARGYAGSFAKAATMAERAILALEADAAGEASP